MRWLEDEEASHRMYVSHTEFPHAMRSAFLVCCVGALEKIAFDEWIVRMRMSELLLAQKQMVLGKWDLQVDEVLERRLIASHFSEGRRAVAVLDDSNPAILARRRKAREMLIAATQTETRLRRELEQMQRAERSIMAARCSALGSLLARDFVQEAALYLVKLTCPQLQRRADALVEAEDDERLELLQCYHDWRRRTFTTIRRFLAERLAARATGGVILVHHRRRVSQRAESLSRLPALQRQGLKDDDGDEFEHHHRSRVGSKPATADAVATPPSTRGKPEDGDVPLESRHTTGFHLRRAPLVNMLVSLHEVIRENCEPCGGAAYAALEGARDAEVRKALAVSHDAFILTSEQSSRALLEGSWLDGLRRLHAHMLAEFELLLRMQLRTTVARRPPPPPHPNAHRRGPKSSQRSIR